MDYTVIVDYIGFWDSPCEAHFFIRSEECADVVAEKAILALICATSVQKIESIEVKYFDEDSGDWVYPYVNPIKDTAFYRSLRLTPPEIQMDIVIKERKKD